MNVIVYVMKDIQDLCWLLSDENFPSIDSGKEFVTWCSNKDIDILSCDKEQVIIEFRKFVKHRIKVILKIMD
jgi:hypothetical protein